MKDALRIRSLKGRLLAWIILPITVFITIDTLALYGSAQKAAHTAYDRMLVTTAYSIGDTVRIDEHGLRDPVPYAALEVYEPGYTTRMIYAIRALDGTLIAGDGDLPALRATWVHPSVVPGLLRIYEDQYGSAPVRVVAVYQPLPPELARPGIVVQIAEPMDLRKSVALRLLHETLLRQAILLLIIVASIMIAVRGALLPLLALRRQLEERSATDLTPVVYEAAPPELNQVVIALNTLMGRVATVLAQQQRFVSDASHQLRTPLAVLKAQVQSGLRGDAPPLTVLGEIAGTADRAVNLANKMLSLAKVEQLRHQDIAQPCDIVLLAQDVAVDLSPLISAKNIDFSLDGGAGTVPGNPWMISELVSNLVHNAIQHTPPGGRIGVHIANEDDGFRLTVWDTGSGIADDIRDSLFQPFSSAHGSKGCGLGLAICAEIAKSMGASLTLRNRIDGGIVQGVDAVLFRPWE
jgi:two-component system sensor histidine kinase TctE